MNLTNKCKTDFGMWHFSRNTPIEEYKNFHLLSDTCKNALIIEFFDSVDIYVSALRFDLKWKPLCNHIIERNFKTRQEATNKAIEKANEIYNKS
jgi:hypothetical protein